jgi:diaminopimelate decarboxylase
MCRALAQWAGQQGLHIDCTGASEIAIAVGARLQTSSIVVHGVNKSQADLDAATSRAGIIVVDNLAELRRLSSTSAALKRSTTPAIWLRLQPGTATETHHAHTQTGQSDSKFGMTPEEIAEAAKLARIAGLPLNGIHFHQGSNFRDAAPLLGAIGVAIQVAREIGLPEAWNLCPGGGWGVAYHEDELPHPAIEEYVRIIARETSKRCRQSGMPLPTLHLEPGRSLVARAGVALYRVGAIKRRKHRTWLLVDGGMADNPRRALYGARYSCLPVKGLGREMTDTVSVGGPFCESADVLIEDLPLPRIEDGELLAIPMSGAYHLSMASNYNGASRPAAVWLETGKSRLIVRRETPEELSHRQLSML